jgi:hypothetical protein
VRDLCHYRGLEFSFTRRWCGALLVGMASSTVVSVCSAPPPTNYNPTISAAPTEPTLSAAASSLPSLSQLSTASGASVDLDDTYAPFDSTEGEEFSSDNNNIDNDYEQKQNQSGTTTSGTFWDLFLSLYLPVMLVWMRRSMFGTMNLCRSLVVGHCLRLVFGNTSEWMTEKAPWLQPFLFQQATSMNGKVDPRAWPPPALTVLAILTIVALVVHPDGCTWIVLGKLR